MTPAGPRPRTSMPFRLRFALLPLAAPLAASAQMHKVAAPEQVTRAVGVYEYVGDLNKPKAARLIPVSLFIGGHFEDAAVYQPRPVPFALESGLRYELQESGVRKDFLDVIASRNFANTSLASAQTFDDLWFGYGRVVPPTVSKAGKAKPNCGKAYVVQDKDNGSKDDSRPHFGSKPAADAPNTRADKNAPDPCRDQADEDRPEKISLADDSKKDKNAPDPERPTLHRSPESSAHNTGENGKPDKKSKPPAATVTANSGPDTDPDRPHIRHRTADEDDPNNLPPDPTELASLEKAKATQDNVDTPSSSNARPPRTGVNDTVTGEGTISGGDTMSGGPVLRRGRMTQPATDPAPSAPATASKGAAPTKPASSAVSAPATPAPLDTIVAVSDARERAAHDFTYKFASSTERAAAVSTLEAMAQDVLAHPALATDASESAKGIVPAPAHSTVSARTSRPGVRTATARTHVSAPAASTTPVLADETVSAFQLYYGAPVSYTFTARIAPMAGIPERYVTVIATTDAEGKLQPAMRSVTDSTHLDRVPRYRVIDVVDADGSNRGSLLLELRAQHSRQFALYRLLGNKPDQLFVSGSTIL